jgi:hypothetical protein
MTTQCSVLSVNEYAAAIIGVVLQSVNAFDD